MKVRTPLLLLTCLYITLLASLYFSRDYLPPSVATHFNAAGQADGWMSRDNHLRAFALSGFLFPAFIIGLCFAIRFFPASALNLPNRDYWTAPDRLPQTYNRIFHHSLWFGCLAVAFLLGIHLSIVEANSHFRPELSLSILLPIAGTFMIGVLIWALTLILPFRRIPQ